ncbi:hypothetical protein FQ775_09570 [Nitratireductor mangrovi]|uniref:HTH luxR-type domain-containing protein n=1 Tax=Nitratireductor mangrovi TaxID=2599600 RepID=A0A5B8KYF2_9HYPH|nr:LuxR C-terminal-related transcriptional regulator [Nitratireductor mangrovi]QDZ00609.1 hypothetical protein FQ775_09570 [Nitratireductor mangrovi]
MLDADIILRCIAGRRSIRGALFALRARIPAFGGCHLAYEYMVQRRAYVRNDMIAMTTLPQKFTSLYAPAGGTNTDPIIDKVSAGRSFLQVDLPAVIADVRSKYAGNRFFGALIEDGCVSLASYCISGAAGIGYAALTVFEDETQARGRPPTRDMLAVARHIHAGFRRRLIAAHLDVTEREAMTLAGVAAGRTAEEIGGLEGVTGRSIEMRLQKVRSKLRARSSAEAIYKAVAYGVLPVDDGAAEQPRRRETLGPDVALDSEQRDAG